MKRIIGYLRPYVWRMILGVSIKFIGSIMDLFIPYILAHIIDVVAPQESIPQLVFWGIMMLVCSVLAIVGNVTANRMASKVSRDATERIRHDLFSRISYLSNKQIDHYTIPSLVTRMTSDTYNLHRIIGMTQRLGVRAPILLIGGICITLTLDPVMTAVLIAMLPLLGAVIFYRSKRGIPLFRKQQEAVDRMVRVVRENASGVRIIKALSKTDYERERFSQVNEEVRASEEKANITMAIVNPVMNLLLNLGLVLVVLVGTWRVSRGLTEAGSIIAFLSYFTIILNALLSVSRIITQFSVSAASANRIAEVLDTPADLLVQEPAEGESTQPDSSAPHIEFQNVSFSYIGKRDNVHDISFSLQKGETLGILGPTGAGKSTLVQLLMRFYDVDKGTVRIGGVDVKNIPMDDLRPRFGVVFQNDTLFEDSIGSNIDLNRNLSPAQLRRAAVYAQAKPFIDAAGGLEAHVTAKGTNLSGGQKQRLLIARALAAHPEILILDDSSSALDYKTDAALRQEIRTHFDGTTTIIVAQRISSIMHADHILVLEDGDMMGYGTHKELMENCEMYGEIYKLQMGGQDNG